jgi:hypothetical protein
VIRIQMLPMLLVACLATSASFKAVAGAAVAADGKSLATAVIITNADDDAAIKAEDDWLDARYPGYTKVSQALMARGGRYFDAIEFKPSGATSSIKVYFDITTAHKASIEMFKGL